MRKGFFLSVIGRSIDRFIFMLLVLLSRFALSVEYSQYGHELLDQLIELDNRCSMNPQVAFESKLSEQVSVYNVPSEYQCIRLVGCVGSSISIKHSQLALIRIVTNHSIKISVQGPVFVDITNGNELITYPNSSQWIQNIDSSVEIDVDIENKVTPMIRFRDGITPSVIVSTSGIFSSPFEAMIFDHRSVGYNVSTKGLLYHPEVKNLTTGKYYAFGYNDYYFITYSKYVNNQYIIYFPRNYTGYFLLLVFIGVLIAAGIYAYKLLGSKKMKEEEAENKI